MKSITVSASKSNWCSATWAKKQGMELKLEQYNPDTFRFFKR